MARYRTPERTITTSPASSPSTAVFSSPAASAYDGDDDHGTNGCLCDVCKADAMFELYIDAKLFEEDGVGEA